MITRARQQSVNAKSAGTALLSCYLAVLCLLCWMVDQSLAPRVKFPDILHLRFFCLILAPMILCCVSALISNNRVVRKASVIATIVFAIPAAALIGLLTFLEESEYYGFGGDRLVRIDVFNQGALGSGPYTLSVFKSAGPLFFKQKRIAVGDYPKITPKSGDDAEIRYYADDREMTARLSVMLKDM